MKLHFVDAAGLGHKAQREQLDPPCQRWCGRGQLPAAWASWQLSSEMAPDGELNKLQPDTTFCPYSPQLDPADYLTAPKQPVLLL